MPFKQKQAGLIHFQTIGKGCKDVFKIDGLSSPAVIETSENFRSRTKLFVRVSDPDKANYGIIEENRQA